MKISIDEVHKLLYYDSITGIFTWKTRDQKNFNSNYAGKIAGSIQDSGYRSMKIGSRNYMAHHLVWAHVYGRWPAENMVIDHIDRNPLNNALENLREVSPAINSNNRVRKCGASGITGVHKAGDKWTIAFTYENRRIRSGGFATVQDAIIALDNARKNANEFYQLAETRKTQVRGEIISHEKLLSTVFYDPITGIFCIKNGDKIGRRLGSLESNYRRIRLFGNKYAEHRLAIFYMIGQWPVIVDHINGNRQDNRYCNLRAVTQFENQLNRKSRNGDSIGIRITAKTKRFEASMQINGKNHHLGTFNTKEEARQAWCDFRSSLGIPLPYTLRSANPPQSHFDHHQIANGDGKNSRL